MPLAAMTDVKVKIMMVITALWERISPPRHGLVDYFWGGRHGVRPLV